MTNQFTRICIGLFILFTIGFIDNDARAQSPVEKQKADNTHSNKIQGPLDFYQKIISAADGDRCPMYPSCSSYAKAAVEKHGILKGWILACDRLMRCGHDEARHARPIKIKGVPHIFDPLEANTFWWENQ
ncbi:MAG: membrane protein insertion efficiency factor YidD [Desulfobacteraceae bacterium]|nr:membrane protein insertion efficiency factor YidD [Desulfobacteraceae bacterium]